MGTRWAPARALMFQDWKKSRNIQEEANLNFHDFFDQKPIMGTRWAPARASIFQDWTQITTPTGTGQFQFELFVSQMTNYGDHMGTCIIGFWRLATKSGNLIRKNPDSYRNRPISEHTLVQPCASSSDIEWGTPIPPPHSSLTSWLGPGF